jgi:hypothetical protein
MNDQTQKCMFSSILQDWKTPKLLYENLDQEFHFNFDPCPPNPTFNGLMVEWKERNYVNPPYNRIAGWIEKAWIESQKGKLVVMLTAARTDTRWFHRYVIPYAKEIRFIKGRLRFNDNPNPLARAPFPSMIVIFNSEIKKDV